MSIIEGRVEKKGFALRRQGLNFFCCESVGAIYNRTGVWYNMGRSYDKIIIEMKGKGVSKMDDKLYDLVEKMYIEFSGNFKQMDQRISSLENGQKKMQLMIENDILDKIKTLYDDRVETKESLACINFKLDNLARVDENHELRNRALEGVS